MAVATIPGPDLALEQAQLAERVLAFWSRHLSDEDRHLLAARGYGRRDRLRSFHEVAVELGTRSPASYRRREQAIVHQIRVRFAGESPRDVSRILTELLHGELHPAPWQLPDPQAPRPGPARL